MSTTKYFHFKFQASIQAIFQPKGLSQCPIRDICLLRCGAGMVIDKEVARTGERSSYSQTSMPIHPLPSQSGQIQFIRVTSTATTSINIAFIRRSMVYSLLVGLQTVLPSFRSLMMSRGIRRKGSTEPHMDFDLGFSRFKSKTRASHPFDFLGHREVRYG